MTEKTRIEAFSLGRSAGRAMRQKDQGLYSFFREHFRRWAKARAQIEHIPFSEFDEVFSEGYRSEN